MQSWRAFKNQILLDHELFEVTDFRKLLISLYLAKAVRLGLLI